MEPNMMETASSPPNFGSPQSPLEMKPDPNMIAMGQHAGHFGSPTGGSSQQRPGSPAANYPPLTGSKHFCSICGDRASGKHYGVYSCEGCKGFFKRTVRKELTYACRENRDCIIDKRQRNRCQYCRYMKCLSTGMRREAVQEERTRAAGSGGGGGGGGKGGENNEMESSSIGSRNSMPIERIIEAESIAEGTFKQDTTPAANNNSGNNSTAAAVFVNDLDNKTTKEKMLRQLIDWAKTIPHFSDLKVDDQLTLIRAGWNELLIAGFSFRSTRLEDGILWADGQVITRSNAHLAGVGEIFDRVLIELVGKMKDMRMDKAELGCLRAIVLFNPDAKGLEAAASAQVESFREKVYATLEEYTRLNNENEPSRFAKLLLRLPALRSIGLKCVEHLFFYKLIKEDNSNNDSNNGGVVSGGDGGEKSLDAFIKEVLAD